MLTARRLRERRRIEAGLPPEVSALAVAPEAVSANEHESAMRNLRGALDTKHALDLLGRDAKIAALERALRELRAESKELRGQLAGKAKAEPTVADVSAEPAAEPRVKRASRTTG